MLIPSRIRCDIGTSRRAAIFFKLLICLGDIYRAVFTFRTDFFGMGIRLGGLQARVNEFGRRGVEKVYVVLGKMGAKYYGVYPPSVIRCFTCGER